MVASPLEYLVISPATEAVIKPCCAQHAEMEQTVDRLIVHLFVLADLLARKICRVNDPVQVACVPDISSKIDALWNEYQQEAEQLGDPVEWHCENETLYRDAFTAMTVAYFSASNILLNCLDLQTSGPNRETVQDSCETILKCSTFLTEKHIGCACLRMFFPLTLVALHSPEEEQRVASHGFLGGWLQDTAFAGLSSIAIQRVQNTDSHTVY